MADFNTFSSSGLTSAFSFLRTIAIGAPAILPTVLTTLTTPFLTADATFLTAFLALSKIFFRNPSNDGVSPVSSGSNLASSPSISGSVIPWTSRRSTSAAMLSSIRPVSRTSGAKCAEKNCSTS